MLLLRPRNIIIFLAVAGALAAAYLVIRGGAFDANDIVLTIRAPRELDIGSETELAVSLTNSTAATLRDGTIELNLPEGIALLDRRDTTFDALPPRREAVAKFRIRVEGEAGTERVLRVRATFRPRQLSATFVKEAEQSVKLRDMPFDVSFAFPSDATNTLPFTFFIRVSSRASEPIGPVGLALTVPESFTITRLRPTPIAEEGTLWDLGVLGPGSREEIAVTGSFTPEAEGGEFVARVGTLDASRRSLLSSRAFSELLNLRVGAVPLDIIVGTIENPKEAVVRPGETIDLLLRYTDRTGAPLEDLSIVLALAHPAIDGRAVRSDADFTRSVSGEYVWSADTVFKLRRVEPATTGTIRFSAPLSAEIPLRTFNDTNQRILVRLRAIADGQILGERQTVLKIAGTVAVSAEVRYFGAPGGRNEGPIPPRVGYETTYTVTLTLTTGTNGVEDAVVRIVLGDHVTYRALIEPTDAVLSYNAQAREVTWEVGGIPAGAGLLTPPKTVSFRISLLPTAADVGTSPELVSAVSVTAKDTFTGGTLDAQARAVDTTLPDDPALPADGGVVQ